MQAECHLAQKTFSDAEKIAQALLSMIKRDKNDTEIRMYDLLRGKIECERGNVSDGITWLRKAADALGYETHGNSVPTNHVRFLDPLANAYYRAGDFDKAIEVYDQIADLTFGRWENGDLYVKSFYMLGKIYEQKGDTAKAIDSYEKFIHFWKNADLGLEEIKYTLSRLDNIR